MPRGLAEYSNYHRRTSAAKAGLDGCEVGRAELFHHLRPVPNCLPLTQTTNDERTQIRLGRIHRWASARQHSHSSWHTRSSECILWRYSWSEGATRTAATEGKFSLVGGFDLQFCVYCKGSNDQRRFDIGDSGQQVHIAFGQNENLKSSRHPCFKIHSPDALLALRQRIWVRY